MDDEIIYSWCFSSVECFDSTSSAAIIVFVEKLGELVEPKIPAVYTRYSKFSSFYPGDLIYTSVREIKPWCLSLVCNQLNSCHFS